MSDPLADIKDDLLIVKAKVGRDNRNNPPNFKKGDILELKEYAGRLDLLWQVVIVYWAGIEPNQYWMVQAHLIGNDKANIWAPHWNFVKYEKKVIIAKENVNENTRGNTSSSSSSGIGNENTVGDPLLSLLEGE